MRPPPSSKNGIKHVLQAPTKLSHRPRILRACIGQSLLWASETWNPTRRRLQRLRGVELKMLKSMIPRPYLPADTPDAQQHAEHKRAVRDTTQKEGYYGFDRAWIKKHHAWAGHLARLPASRWATHALHERNLDWWKNEQKKKKGKTSQTS